jgi:hypothetical protein
MLLALRNEIGYSKVWMALKNRIPPLPLAPNPRVPQEEAAKALAREVEVAMAPVVQRDAMAARLTTIVSTRLRIVVLPPLFRAPGAGLLLQILNLHPHLRKSRHRPNLRPQMGHHPLSSLVKIAGQRSLRSGDGTSMGTPSATLVVRLLSSHTFILSQYRLTNRQQVCTISSTVAIVLPP